jgi:hypothetical protein
MKEELANMPGLRNVESLENSDLQEGPVALFYLTQDEDGVQCVQMFTVNTLPWLILDSKRAEDDPDFLLWLGFMKVTGAAHAQKMQEQIRVRLSSQGAA